MGAIEGEVDSASGIDRVQARDREDPVTGRRVDLNDRNLQHERQPEDGCREPEEAERRRGVVEGGVLAQSRVHADSDCDQDGEKLGDKDELKRVLHHPPEVGQDRPVAEQGRAELVRHRVVYPVPVPDGDRVVEVLLVDDVLLRLLGEVRDDVQLRERVAGDRDEREENEAGRDEDDDAIEEPANDVAQHVSTSRILEGSPAPADRANGTSSPRGA